MKKVLVTVLAMMAAQTTFAGDLYCGANAESAPGSQTYSKQIFFEKVRNENSFLRFRLEDGTLVRSEEMTIEYKAKLVDGTQVMGVSFNQGKPSLFLAKVKNVNENGLEVIKYVETAIALPLQGKSVMLLANKISLFCNEL